MHLDHINIVVTDLEKSQKFFQLLGFETKDDAMLEGEWISDVVGLPDVKARYVKMKLPGDETFLELIQYFSPVGNKDPDLAKPNQIGFRHMAFSVKNIDEIVAHLKENDVEFMSEIRVFPKTGKKLLYFKGPDGIVMEFAQYNEIEQKPKRAHT